jgi:phenylacetate-CoA ligase
VKKAANNMMIDRKIAKLLFVLGGKITGDNVEKHLQHLNVTQWYKKDDLDKLQWRKLKRLIVHAYKNCPFYRERFDSVGLIPEDVKSKKDFEKIPLLTKEDLKENYLKMKSSDKKYRYSLAKTSGSTGKSVKFFKDRLASGNGRAAMYRGHGWYHVGIGDREARLWGVPFDKKKRMITMTGDFILNRFRVKDFNIDARVLDDFTKKIIKYKPDYLMGYSSLVYEYGKYLDEKKINGRMFSFKMVKVTAENLFKYQKEFLEEYFGCSVINEYGAAEVGIVAFECPHGNMHIAAEGVYVEENKGTDIAHNELIITDLDNYCTPILRYQIGDFGKISNRHCRCGREGPVLEKIIGRTSDIVYADNGERVHSSIFSYILKEITSAYGGIKQYKIIQEKIGEININIKKDANFNSSAIEFIKQQVKKYLGDKTAVNINFVDRIERENSGKLRYFVSKIG